MNSVKVHILFTRPKHWNPISGMIQFVEKVDFSHVVIAYDSQDFQKKMIIQSKLFNTHLMTLGAFMESSEIVKGFEFEMTQDQFQKGMHALGPRMGEGYAYLQLILLALKRFFGIVFPFEAIGNMCSETMALFLCSSGMVPPMQLDSCDVGLIEAFEMNTKHGKLL